MLVHAAAGRAGLRLLDCGCGTGTNLRLLLEPYGRAWGFDLTWTGLQFARGSGVTRVAQASAAAIPYPSAAFDIVTSFDVLYCLPDEVEREAIREMWRVLRPGGAAIINVAAMEILRGNHSVLSAELRRYSRASLRERLERAGFRVERMTYTNAALFPVDAHRARRAAHDGAGAGKRSRGRDHGPAWSRQRGARCVARGRGGRRAGLADAFREFASLPG